MLTSSVMLAGALVTGLAPRPAGATSPPIAGTVDPPIDGSRATPPPRTLAPVHRLRVLVIPIWFSRGTVGTIDPTQGSGALPPSRFGRALTSDVSGNSARRWWSEASFRQVDLSGTVTPWIRVPLKAPSPNGATIGSCGRQDYVDAAVAGAASRGFRQADYDQVVVIALASTCTVSGVAGTRKDGETARTAATFLHATDDHDTLVFLFAHELLHNLGLGHANGVDCGVGTTRIADAMDPSAHCEHREYEDHTSVMGRLDPASTPAHHPSAAEKAAVGWLTTQAGDITDIPVSSLTTEWRQVPLHRSNVRGSGPILLRLVHDVEGGAPGTTTVELRGGVAPTGSPAHTFEPMSSMWGGSSQPWLQGTTVRSDDELIDTTPQTATASDAPLLPGASTVITSPGGPNDRPWIGAVEVRTVSVIGDTAVVAVRRPPSIAQPAEAADACFDMPDPYPSTVSRLDLTCSTFAPQQRISVGWGDGSATVAPAPLLVPPQLVHTYPSDAARCYTVTLRIDRTDGGPPSIASKTIVRGRDGRPPCLLASTPAGAAVATGSAPWVASIRMGTHHSCGGALVAPSRVLTTASCLRRGLALAGWSPAPIDVVVGSSSLGPEASSVEHHGLDPGSPMVASPGGLLLLHLAGPAAATPATITGSTPPLGSPVATLGWGDVHAGLDAWWPRSTLLLRTSLVVRPVADCDAWIEGSIAALGATTPGEAHDAGAAGVCVGAVGQAREGGCAGDLGGPVVVPGSPDELVGLVEAAPGIGPGGLAGGVCGARARVLTLGPQLSWVQQQI